MFVVKKSGGTTDKVQIIRDGFDSLVEKIAFDKCFEKLLTQKAFKLSSQFFFAKLFVPYFEIRTNIFTLSCH